MARRNKGYQLDFYTPKGYSDPQWVVFWYKHGVRRERATGVKDSAGINQAEEWRAAFVASQERPSGPAKPDSMTVAQALSYYAQEHAPGVVDGARIGYAIKALLPFFGHQPVSAVKGETCRRYARERKREANTVRRELGVLSAALTHCRREGYLIEAPAVWLPEPAPPRDRWLTRVEAAALIRAARKEPYASLHLPYFILLGLYTGHRSEAILSLQWTPNMTGGYVDLERGIIDFNPVGARKTNKRRSIIPIPGGLLIHLRNLRQRTVQYVIEDMTGKPIKSCKRSFRTACRKADPSREAGRQNDLLPKDKHIEPKGIVGVVRHTLRHTACTWFMHRGVDPELAAPWVGMSVETFRRKYLHHHPDYMKAVSDSFRKSPSLSPSLRR